MQLKRSGRRTIERLQWYEKHPHLPDKQADVKDKSFVVIS